MSSLKFEENDPDLCVSVITESQPELWSLKDVGVYQLLQALVCKFSLQ